MSDKLSDKLKSSDKSHTEKLIAYLEKYWEINAQTAAQVLGRAPETARRVLGEMVSKGLIAAEGANRNRTYRLLVR